MKSYCACNFCLEIYQDNDGVFYGEKYFVCYYCNNVLGLLEKIKNKDENALTEAKGWLIDSRLENLQNQIELEDIKGNRENYFKKQIKIKTPKEIKAELDQYVIGQDDAKKTLSNAAFNHLLRIKNPDVTLPKNNVLLIGDSGTGKTYLVKTLSKILDVPLHIADASSFTQFGYKGLDVTDMLISLLEMADGDLDVAEKGIIYIDEIDKISMKSYGSDSGDINGRGVQINLLKLLEGSMVSIQDKRMNFDMDTSNILFIMGGVFSDIDKIVEKRLNVKTIGFNNTHKKKNDLSLKTEDFIKFGFMREFIGRINSVEKLKKLSKNDLKCILKNSKDSVLENYKNLYKLLDVELDFEDGFIDQIATEAILENLGARGLVSILEKKLKNCLFETPDSNKKKLTLKRNKI
jgi:ATP-dependent Clp protease ATP-binding subunit ClpX